MSPRFLPAVLLFAALAVGCKVDPDQALVGSFNLDASQSQIPDVPGMKAAVKKLKENFERTNLKLSADKTFALSGVMNIRGKWNREGQNLTLIMDGRDAKETRSSLKLTISPDFNTLSSQEGNTPIPLVFKRAG